MVMCSACESESDIQVQGYSLCHDHGRGMMIAVLTGDYTPVGYIMAASCGLVIQAPEVSAPETISPVKRVSEFMRHGALAALPQPKGASAKSGCPAPIRAQAFA